MEVHGDGQVILLISDLRMEDKILNVDVTKLVQGRGDASQKSSNVALTWTRRVALS